MDQEELRHVPRTIRDYVIRAGGKVFVEDLVEDFKVAYGSNVPFEEFGYRDLFSFLRNIYGVRLVEENGMYELVTIARKKDAPKSPLQSDDISNITVKLANNLVIGCHSGSRKVTVKPSNAKTNISSRRAIINKMNLYSSSLKESTKLNEPNVCEPYTSNFTEYPYYSNSLVDDLSNNVYEANGSVTSEESTLENAEEFPSSYSSNVYAESNYSESPHYISLIHLIMKHRLEYPVFETFTNVSPIDNSISFTTVLRVGTDNFISPTYNDLPRKSMYENLLKDAYESLQKKYDLFENHCQYDVVTQILEVINSFKNGADMHTIEAAYIQKYATSPPQNWVNLLRNTSSIYIENLGDQIIMYPSRIFLTSTPFSTALPPKVYPPKDTWNIQITNCVNTNNIWFRILEDDYNHRYENLLTAMRAHYKGHVISDVKNVKANELYACFHDGNWCRVEVLDGKGKVARCMLIDSGIEEDIPLINLFPLNHKFTNTPPLAFRCSMGGLSKYEKVNYLKCQLHGMLNNEIAYAKVDSDVNDELSLNIYLKNSSFNICVNQYFLNKIKKELQVPNIKEIGKVFDVRVFYIEESGVARVNVESDSLSLLKQSINRAMEMIRQDAGKCYQVHSMLAIDREKVYLALIDNTWERVMVKKIVNGDKIEVNCIDTGDVATIDLQNIFHVNQLPDTLLHISPQIQYVQISQIDDKMKKVIRFMNGILTQIKHPVMLHMKVVQIAENPAVEFYRKLYDDQMVPLKNLYLSSCDQITSINFINNLSNILPSELCFDLFGNYENMANLNIPRYKLQQGQTLKVTVMKTLNPSNFVLKIKNHSQFDELMLKLNNYNMIFAPEPIQQISLGRCYAVKLENGFWYRGLALFVMEDLKTAVIRLLDFAETVSVPISGIFPLPAEFYSLPVQTFSAELLIKPIHGQWTGEDCFRFKEAVYTKILDCVIVDNSSALVKVLLLDTSNKREVVNISSIFVQEKRAV